MKLIVIILNNTEHLEDLLTAFLEIGVTGSTVIDSVGMGRILSHDVPIFVRAQQVVGAFQTQPRGHATARVSRHEQVVGAFGRTGISHQAAFGAYGVKIVIPSGDHLVRIDLVPRVPDQSIPAEIERGVKGQTELDHAQVRGEMGGPLAQQLAKRLAHLGSQPVELLEREPFKVLG